MAVCVVVKRAISPATRRQTISLREPVGARSAMALISRPPVSVGFTPGAVPVGQVIGGIGNTRLVSGGGESSEHAAWGCEDRLIVRQAQSAVHRPLCRRCRKWAAQAGPDGCLGKSLRGRVGPSGALRRGGRHHIVARQQRWEPGQLKVQEWIQAVFAWIGITDPLAVSVGVGVVVGFALAMVATVVVRLILFVVSSAVGFRR